MSIDPRIEESWKQKLLPQFRAQYFEELKQFLLEERKNQEVYPSGSNIFKAFDSCPFQNVKVVILGQDPYHGPGQAHGLSFSVPEGVKLPPSLKNIFKELEADLGHSQPISGNLEAWANSGVLLLNATLTVRKSSPGSHQKRGWETFTDSVIRLISDEKQHVVFLLWGNYARAKRDFIDSSKHLIHESAHPSPFSARNGFFGSEPFSKANQYLKSHGIDPIDWDLAT